MDPKCQEPSPAAAGRPEVGAGRRIAATAAVAMTPLAPLLTTQLPFEFGRLAQVVPMVGVLVLALAVGLLWPAAGWFEMPRSTKWGLGLYGGAACWGTIVGIVMGHPIGRVANQALAMMFLAAAAVVFSRCTRRSGEPLVLGAVLISLGFVAATAYVGETQSSLSAPRPGEANAVAPESGHFRLAAGDAEWQVAYEQIRWASTTRLLAGKGLGALEPLALPGGEQPPQRAFHNFYLFLVHQLGVAGFAALTGLLLLLFGSFENLWNTLRRSASWTTKKLWRDAAIVAVWVAFFLGGTTSAVLLDPRIALLLGTTVALQRTPAHPEEKRVAPEHFRRNICQAILAALGLLTIAIPWYHGEPSHEESMPTAVVRDDLPNIVLISIDTLRADHLGCYGYPRETSPVLDQLARESLLYANAQAPTPWTLPSHAGMLTGIHPFDLGIRSRSATLPAHAPLLAEHLRGLGYRTAAFVDSPPDGFLGVRRGFGRGFDLYRHAPHAWNQTFIYDFAVTVDVAARWLHRRDTARPFFLFLHTKSVHSVPDDAPHRPPYDQPAGYNHRFRSPDSPLNWTTPDGKGGSHYLADLNKRLRAGEVRREDFPAERHEALVDLYDAGIYYVDEQLGRFLALLESSGVRDQTLVIVTSDHGEAFLEHRQFLHTELYRQLLHVPLIVSLPGERRGGVIRQLTALIDIVPTILELVGSPRHEGLSTRSLPFKEAQHDPDAVLSGASRTLFAYLGTSQEREAHQAFALLSATRKFVYHDFETPGEFVSELYDLRQDLEEQHPIEDHQDEIRKYLEALEERLQRMPDHEPENIEVEEETRKLLKTLGYL